jgi:hypothetical protein
VPVGRIAFDKFTILLRHEPRRQMIFKHAIATVGPGARGRGQSPEGATLQATRDSLRSGSEAWARSLC